MKGMKSCSKCMGGECKGGKGCMMEEKKEMPKRGQRTIKAKAKKKK
jgi:hypothetical protein